MCPAPILPRERRSASGRRADGNVAAVSHFDLLILKVVSQSRVMWATSVPILVSLSLSVLDLGPMYATDRQTSESIIA